VFKYLLKAHRGLHPKVCLVLNILSLLVVVAPVDFMAQVVLVGLEPGQGYQ
jgi:hypothetical protein